MAQEAAQATATNGAGQLEEIVVTARKTEEKLQTAPLSVTALTATKLEAQNVTTAAGLNGLVPNLNITQGAAYGTSVFVTIRGVNQADVSLTNDAPIALYIDGVYNGRAMGSLFDLVDLQRVEVLRGPQGTLFGRNTTGGAINFITKGPSDDFSIEEKTSFGSYGDFRSRTEFDTGLIGNTGLKALLAYSHHQNDGYIRNVLTSDDNGPGSVVSDSFYFALHGDLTDNLSFDYHIDYTTEDDQAQEAALTVASPVDKAFFSASPLFGGAPLVISPTRLSSDAVYDVNPPNHDEIYGHALTIDYDFSDALRLKSISAYRSFADDSHFDQSAQGMLLGPVFGAGGVTIQPVSPFRTLCPGNTPSFPSNSCDHQRQYQISEEVQATGTIGEFKNVCGLIYFDEKVHEQDPEFLTI
ncbi:MAG: TonB-dependent receptor, partial [Rhodospirillales bacterium]|nr:TonB-dependent receptor [Rhodospirillales bacterium]